MSLTPDEWDRGVLALVNLWLRGELSPQGLIEALTILGPRPVTT